MLPRRQNSGAVHQGRQAGDTLTALTHDPRALENFLGWSLPALAADIVLPVAVIVVLAVIDLPMALAVAVSVVIAVQALRWTLRRYGSFATARQELQAQTVSRIVEHIQGIAAIRAFNQADTQPGRRSRHDRVKSLGDCLVARNHRGDTAMAMPYLPSCWRRQSPRPMAPRRRTCKPGRRRGSGIPHRCAIDSHIPHARR